MSHSVLTERFFVLFWPASNVVDGMSSTSPALVAEVITPYQSNLEHLEDHLRRLSEILAAHVARLPVSSRQRRAENADLDIERLANFGSFETPPKTQALWTKADRRLEHIRAREAVSRVDLPLARICTRFGLSQREQDILMLSCATHLDPRFQQHWDTSDLRLDPPNIRTMLSVMARTFHDGVKMRRLFSTDAPLFANSLLLAQSRFMGECDFLDTSIEAPRRVIGELLGESHVAEELIAFSRVKVPQVSLSQVVLPTETKHLVVSLVKNHSRFLERRAEWGIDEVVTYGKAMVLLFSGPPGTGKTMLAQAVARELGKRIFSIDIPKLLEGGRDLESNLDSVFREAKLLDTVLFFDECELLFSSRRHGNAALPILLTRLEQFDGVALLATNMANVLDEALARRVVAAIEFRPPTTKARAEIWKKHLPERVPLSSEVNIDALAERFELSGGLIKNAVLAAVHSAVSRDDGVVTQRDLEHGARLQLRISEDMANQLTTPTVQLQDVFIPTQTKERIARFIQSARCSSTILGDWGLEKILGKSSAQAALISGPPGTGKSMVAEAIARELDRPLLRCHLPSVVSRYVGDTAKNLDALFTAARQHRAVLVFDEADALFARRVQVSNSNDRFVNSDTGSLLTQLEQHNGVVILTTNLQESIDPAFDRRLHLQVTLGMPDLTTRLALWRRLLGTDAPLANDIDPMRLARSYELSGAAIRNAILQAALEAASSPAHQRQITAAQLERAAAEQLVNKAAIPSGHALS